MPNFDVPFFKVSGSGNDFVVFIEENCLRILPKQVSRICDRHHGIGADGVVLLRFRGNCLDFEFFNSDGSSAPACGNALLCCAQLLHLFPIDPTKPTVIETSNSSYTVHRLSCNSASVSFRNLTYSELDRCIKLQHERGERAAFTTTVGVAHVSVLVDRIGEVDVLERGRALRYDAGLAPEGANISFVEYSRSSNIAELRTYERGVEDETLACATGAVAAAASLFKSGILENNSEVEFRPKSGLMIKILLSCKKNAFDASLIGESRIVFRGFLPNLGEDFQ